MKSNTFFTAIIVTLLFVSCNKSENTVTESKEELTVTANEINKVIKIEDSLAITQLLRDMHKWHMATIDATDFDVYLAKPTDSIWAGINTKKHEKRLEALRATNFFTDGFLNNYDKIAKTIDGELKSGNAIYPVGELPPYGNDAVPWTNSQDEPENYWTKMKVSNLAYSGDIVNFTWDFNDTKNLENNKELYRCKFKKVNEKWKIDWLQGFDYKPFTEGLYNPS